MNNHVHVWEEDILLPTYGTGLPEKNPVFLEKRVYQGSSGAVYPYPVIESIQDTCADRLYHAVFLENDYLKIMVLPQLGGRIQMAYDKLKQRHFIYYNRVIKPALVGLTGPWISGGIEFNWPQHHRPSTFLPVDFAVERYPDGSATVWVSELERMTHQKGMAGFTLYPGRAVLEVKGVLYNPTPLPQTFLWWANPAVAVNEHYQSVFPADVHAVFDHGKRDVSRYPVATGTYYKTDYSAGVDISRYKNIPVPTSYMAGKSKYDFIGGYENDTRAGVLHVANHHIAPGKKQWTWGNGDFGRAWYENLTDADGPYIELMTGVFTDNQPDFSWIQPYEEKRFSQYFIPYRELGVVKNATADLLMNLEPEGGACLLKISATSAQPRLHIVVYSEHATYLDTVADLSPETVYTASLPFSGTGGIRVTIGNEAGHTLLSWEAEPDEIQPLPDAARPASAPDEIRSVEQLYLTGLHLEQYRHAVYCAADYYEEALRRDATDLRSNNAMGLWLIRRGRFAQAESYLRQAVQTLTERNPNPYDGEPLYNLALSLRYQGKYEEAYGFFYKACWNAAWQDAGYYALAQLSACRQEWESVCEETGKSLARNWHNHRARHLQAIAFRYLGRPDDALKLIRQSLETDCFDFGCLFEEYLLTETDDALARFTTRMRDEAHNYEELALDYAAAGRWNEAVRITGIAERLVSQPDPLLYYYRSWFFICKNESERAAEAAATAERQPAAPFFPNRLEAIQALQAVSRLPVPVPKAWYYLGNIWYDKRQYAEAAECWEASARIDGTFPTVWRNLALAGFNKLGKPAEAVTLLEKAYALDTSDARILLELDQLYKRLNRPHVERLAFLGQHYDVVLRRDDLYLEYVTLLNQTGRYEDAIRLIDERRFHPWEGGEGKVPAQYQLARIERAKRLAEEQAYEEALSLIETCFVYPSGLGEGKLAGAKENDLLYYKACILDAWGRREEAAAVFCEATRGNLRPTAALYYNDQQPDKLFYQGLAFRRTGNERKARSCFNSLVSYGEKHLYDRSQADYFAVSLPELQVWEEDADKRNRVRCYYLMGLGWLGLEEFARASRHFGEAARLDLNHQGVQIHRAMAERRLKNPSPSIQPNTTEV